MNVRCELFCSSAACQRRKPSSLAAVIGLSNNDVISLRFLYVECVAFGLSRCACLRASLTAAAALEPLVLVPVDEAVACV